MLALALTNNTTMEHENTDQGNVLPARVET